MVDPARLERLVRRVAGQVRRRRLEFYGLKGAFWGSLAAVVPLLVKGVAGPAASVVAAGLVALGAAAGAAFGLALKAPGPDVARVADRAFGLEDRVATAVEWARRPDRTPLVDRLVEDAIAHVEGLQSSAAVRRVLPGEARLLPLPLLVVLALAFAPAVRLPVGRTSDVAAHSDVEGAPDRVGKLETSDQALAKPEAAKPGPLSERDVVQASPSLVSASDRPALFKDTALGAQRPDFSSFLRKGDERLKLLEQVESLPDLQSDFTQSAYKAMLDQSKTLTQGLRPEQVPAQKLRQLLEQMEQLGNKQAQEAAQNAAQGLKALEHGQQEKAIDAMNRSLNTLRHAEEERKGALNLSGGKQGDTGRRSSESGESKDLGNSEQEDPGGSKGLEPGKGPGEHPKGEATPRLGAKPYDSEVEGDPRSGKKDSVETNTFGRAARVPSRLPSGSAFDQYQRMMEEAIAREEVPRDYQPQVKDYFRALSEK
jgi:hypothetical protein